MTITRPEPVICSTLSVLPHPLDVLVNPWPRSKERELDLHRALYVYRGGDTEAEAKMTAHLFGNTIRCIKGRGAQLQSGPQ